MSNKAGITKNSFNFAVFFWDNNIPLINKAETVK